MTLSHSFSVEHAEKYGLECAVLISHFQFWIEQNKALGRNFHDGRTWMFQSQKEIAAIYPYFSEETVFRIIKKLLDADVLIKGNYNKSPFDRTTWYAFKNEKMFTIPRNRKMHSSTSQNANFDIEAPIPDTNTDLNVVVVVGGNPPPLDVGNVHNFAQEVKKEITKDDVYHYSLASRTDWLPAEIEYAWNAFKQAATLITDAYAYIAGIIAKKRILDQNKCQKNEREKSCQTKSISPQQMPSVKEKSENTKKETSELVIVGPAFANFGFQSTNKKKC